MVKNNSVPPIVLPEMDEEDVTKKLRKWTKMSQMDEATLRATVNEDHVPALKTVAVNSSPLSLASTGTPRTPHVDPVDYPESCGRRTEVAHDMMDDADDEESHHSENEEENKTTDEKEHPFSHVENFLLMKLKEKKQLSPIPSPASIGPHQGADVADKMLLYTEETAQDLAENGDRNVMSPPIGVREDGATVRARGSPRKTANKGILKHQENHATAGSPASQQLLSGEGTFKLSAKEKHALRGRTAGRSVKLMEEAEELGERMNDWYGRFREMYQEMFAKVGEKDAEIKDLKRQIKALVAGNPNIAAELQCKHCNRSLIPGSPAGIIESNLNDMVPHPSKSPRVSAASARKSHQSHNSNSSRSKSPISRTTGSPKPPGLDAPRSPPPASTPPPAPDSPGSRWEFPKSFGHAEPASNYQSGYGFKDFGNDEPMDRTVEGQLARAEARKAGYKSKAPALPLTEEDEALRLRLLNGCLRCEVDQRTIDWFMMEENAPFYPVLLEKTDELEKRRADPSSPRAQVRNPSAWLTKFFNAVRRDQTATANMAAKGNTSDSSMPQQNNKMVQQQHNYNQQNQMNQNYNQQNQMNQGYNSAPQQQNYSMNLGNALRKTQHQYPPQSGYQQAQPQSGYQQPQSGYQQQPQSGYQQPQSGYPQPQSGYQQPQPQSYQQPQPQSYVQPQSYQQSYQQGAYQTMPSGAMVVNGQTLTPVGQAQQEGGRATIDYYASPSSAQVQQAYVRASEAGAPTVRKSVVFRRQHTSATSANSIYGV